MNPEEQKATTTITALENGPYMVNGEFEVIDKDFNTVPTRKNVYLCRCGGSSKKPICDSTHLKNGFKD